MNKYKLTLIGLGLSVFIYLINIALGLDLYEYFVFLLINIEQFKFGELVIPAAIFLLFIYLDAHRRKKKNLVENAKLDIYKAMLSCSHHIINNFMYQMDLFKITAEDTPGFDTQILSFYEDIISNTSHQIYSLSNLENIDEFSIRTSILDQ